MKGTLVKAPQDLAHNIDLSTERVAAEEFEVDAEEVRVTYVPDGCSFQLSVVSANGPFHTIDRAGTISWCNKKLPSVWVKNAAQSGVAELQYSPDGIAFDFPPKADPVAAPREYVARVAASFGNNVIEQLTGGVTGGNKIRLQNIAYVAHPTVQMDTVRIKAAKSGVTNVEAYIDVVYALSMAPWLPNGPAGVLNLFEGRKLCMEATILLENATAGGGLAQRAFFGIGRNYVNPRMVGWGLWFTEEHANWYHGAQWGCSLDAQWYLGPGNTDTSGRAVRVLTNVPALNVTRHMKMEIGVKGGQIYQRFLADGVVISEYVGRWPVTMNPITYVDAGAWYPRLHVIRQSANGIDEISACVPSGLDVFWEGE